MSRGGRDVADAEDFASDHTPAPPESPLAWRRTSAAATTGFGLRNAFHVGIAAGGCCAVARAGECF